LKAVEKIAKEHPDLIEAAKGIIIF